MLAHRNRRKSALQTYGNEFDVGYTVIKVILNDLIETNT
jgi:hypothetical protein